jgi:hypothetical protein
MFRQISPERASLFVCGLFHWVSLRRPIQTFAKIRYNPQVRLGRKLGRGWVEKSIG